MHRCTFAIKKIFLTSGLTEPPSTNPSISICASRLDPMLHAGSVPHISMHASLDLGTSHLHVRFAQTCSCLQNLHHLRLNPAYTTACRVRNRKTWRECVNDNMKVLGLQPEWAIFRGYVEGFHMGKCPTIA